MNELIQALVKQLGVTSEQAEKGSGLLFKAAKERLGGDFAKVEQALPEVSKLIQGAPSGEGGGGLGGMLGGLASMLGGGGEKLGALASLASGFSSLKLSPDMIGRFVPVILETVKAKGGGQLVELLKSAMK